MFLIAAGHGYLCTSLFDDAVVTLKDWACCGQEIMCRKLIAATLAVKKSRSCRVRLQNGSSFPGWAGRPVQGCYFVTGLLRFTFSQTSLLVWRLTQWTVEP